MDFLRLKDQERRLICVSNRLSEDAFRKVWDNPDNAYDDSSFVDIVLVPFPFTDQSTTKKIALPLLSVSTRITGNGLISLLGSRMGDVHL